MITTRFMQFINTSLHFNLHPTSFFITRYGFALIFHIKILCFIYKNKQFTLTLKCIFWVHLHHAPALKICTLRLLTFLETVLQYLALVYILSYAHYCSKYLIIIKKLKFILAIVLYCYCVILLLCYIANVLYWCCVILLLCYIATALYCCCLILLLCYIVTVLYC